MQKHKFDRRLFALITSQLYDVISLYQKNRQKIVKKTVFHGHNQMRMNQCRGSADKLKGQKFY